MTKRSKLTARIKKLEAQLKRRGLKRVAKTKQGSVHVVPETPPKKSMRIPDDAASWSMVGTRSSRLSELSARIYAAAKPMPGVLPNGNDGMAMDEQLKTSAKAAALALDEQVLVQGGWGYGDQGYGAFAEGQMFLGYPYLAELSQRPEYRVISETIATEATRKWIKIKAKGHEGDKAEAISQLEDELKRLNVQECFTKIAEQDGFFGRSHLYMDIGDTSDPSELISPVGNGTNDISGVKVAKGAFKRLQVIEPVWTYPTRYNANDPLQPDWYKPESWFVMGKQVHVSRLLTFVCREVPDLLKPAYAFGGLSMSQMAKPYVDNWLRTRQSVADITHAFTVWDLSTDLSGLIQAGGEEIMKRVNMFRMWRDNKGVMLTNKDTEELKNVSAPLSTLDALQAQAQEQMAAVSRIPLVKLLGISPHGLNASSEGEIRTFYDSINAYQNKFFKDKLDVVFAMAQRNIWGAVDPELFYEFEQLWALDEKGEAEVEKIKADTDAVLVDVGAIDAMESRERVAGAEDSDYASLDLSKVITPPQEMGGGLGAKELGISQGGGLGGNVSGFSEAAE